MSVFRNSIKLLSYLPESQCFNRFGNTWDPTECERIVIMSYIENAKNRESKYKKRKMLIRFIVPCPTETAFIA